MPGVGKTTLAMKVYKDLSRSFDTHSWCYVSKDYQKISLLKHLLHKINGASSNIDDMGEEDLAMKLYQSLHRKKYLIVLDDIWDAKSWRALKACFPTGNNGSRILLTSRFKSIGMEASVDSTFHELGLLPLKKSWKLLQKMVFGPNNCPMQLRAVGKEIAKKSEGLPLSIAVLAGVLKAVDRTEDRWRQVEKSLDSLIEHRDAVWNKLELSYNHLSVPLRQCFLYCGAVSRKGKELLRSELVHLWIAERFIVETDQHRNLEAVAEEYLSDLVERSLLLVTKKGSNSRIRACRIHDLLQEFCIKKAEQEKFSQVMNGWGSNPSEYTSARRLFICCKLDDFLMTGCPPSRPSTRSLLVFGSGYEWDLKQFNTPFLFENFGLLTVLDLRHMHAAIHDILPDYVSTLIFLRYLAVKVYDRIPSFIGELLNLEILIVEGIQVMGRRVTMPGSIFKLTKLRHLRVNHCTDIDGKEIICGSLPSLQSFSCPAFSRTTVEQIISCVPNLRKLKCVFLKSEDDSIKCDAFPVLDTLCSLETLNVIDLGLAQHPRRFSLPVTLKKLTLSHFGLPWTEMKQIAELPLLEILKLSTDAFEGKTWHTTSTFSKLKYLRLVRLNVEAWEASEDQYPELEQLVVRDCNNLKAIPSGFSDIETFKGIEIDGCDPVLTKSAMQIEYRQRKYSGNKLFKTNIIRKWHSR